MRFICKLVGHQPPVYAKSGWYSPGQEYGRLELGAVDGIGRQHATVVGDCARCGKQFRLARVHVPNTEAMRHAAKEER
jgi:hypothetical protein